VSVSELKKVRTLANERVGEERLPDVVVWLFVVSALVQSTHPEN
jgi:hypothetical protein